MFRAVKSPLGSIQRGTKAATSATICGKSAFGSIAWQYNLSFGGVLESENMSIISQHNFRSWQGRLLQHNTVYNSQRSQKKFRRQTSVLRRIKESMVDKRSEEKRREAKRRGETRREENRR